MGKEAETTAFARGRDEGLDIAIRLLEGGGTIEDIRREVKFRKAAGISMGLSHKELDKASERIKLLTYGTMRIAMAASIADAYGFGAKRIQKALDNFSKLVEYMDHGWVYWLDIVTELKARYRLDLEIDGGMEVLKHYSRPEPADVWEEPDLVLKEDWDDILQRAGMVQGTSKYGYPCVFYKGIALIEYQDRYQQVEAFSMIQGILLERELREELSSRPDEPPKPKQGVPQGKAQKKHRRKR